MKTVNFCDFSGANHIEGQERIPSRKESRNMNRKKQRRNRREKIRREKQELLEAFIAVKKIKREKPWLNHEGYHDPTAYLAIRNVEKLYT